MKFLTIILLMVAYSTCYPSGAPLSTCDTMKPKHKDEALISSYVPFSIKVDKSVDFYTGKRLNNTKIKIKKFFI